MNRRRDPWGAYWQRDRIHTGVMVYGLAMTVLAVLTAPLWAADKPAAWVAMSLGNLALALTARFAMECNEATE